MVLGVDKLLQLVKEANLVENLCERELTNPEGAGFDLCLGRVHRISGKGFMGLTERDSANAEQILEFNAKKKQSILMQPGESFLVTTREKINLPQNLTANMTLRGTLYRSGIVMSGGNSAPGYKGELSFLLFNSGSAEMEIELGARIVHIMFFEVDGQTAEYRGQWKGGRVSTSKPEIQV